MMGWWWLLCQLGEDRFPREFKMQSELLKNLSIYYSLFNRYLKDLTSFITGPWILVSQDQASIDPKSRQVKSINVIHVLLYMVLLNNIDLPRFGNLKVNSEQYLKKKLIWWLLNGFGPKVSSFYDILSVKYCVENDCCHKNFLCSLWE